MKHYAIPSNLIKLMLSLTILGLVTTLPFLSYKAFTHQYTPINGFILVLATLGILIWLTTISNNRKYKYIKPGFWLVTFGCLIIFLVTAFAGIQPMSDYKDKMLSKISSPTIIQPSNTPSPPVTPIEPPPTVAVVPPKVKTVPPPETEVVIPVTPETHSGKVWIDSNTYLVGGNWQPIILIDNPIATNPTSTELFSFLQADQTDTHLYLPSYVCADFAETLHNNAEGAGIRTAIVILSGIDHALNAFETTDGELIFIDCTGDTIHTVIPPWLQDQNSVTFGETDSCDKVAYLQVGKPLGFISLENAKPYGFKYYNYEAGWCSDKALFDTKSENYNREMETHNREVEDYTRALGGRYSLEEPEYSRFAEWYDRLEKEEQRLDSQLKELEELANRLGGFWGTVGIVSDFEIIWNGEK